MVDPNEPLRSLTVLVIEDNRDAADSLAMLLLRRGHIVHIAEDGKAGLEMARTLNPHVILLDIGLPKTNGFVVAKTLRRDLPSRRPSIIAITGYADDTSRGFASAAGIDVYLVKPAEPETILKLIDQFTATNEFPTS